MKKLINVVMLTLAVNFLALAGGVGWLVKEKHLDRERITAIKEILFPKPVEAAPATQPSETPTTQPIMQLEDLLVKASGRTASEQVEFIQHAFDSQMAILERRERELTDLQRQVDLAKQQMARDRVALDLKEKAQVEREQAAQRLANDKGFQDSLALYTSLPPKQVKTIFMGLDQKTVVEYVRAMETSAAGKIMKEFKSPEETQRIQEILESIRQADEKSSALTKG